MLDCISKEDAVTLPILKSVVPVLAATNNSILSYTAFLLGAVVAEAGFVALSQSPEYSKSDTAPPAASCHVPTPVASVVST